MYPPSATCRALHRLHKNLRIAWAGRERHNDELNAGSFAIVQLYHISNAGKPEEENTILAHWDNGPIYNKDGGSTRDWDPLFYVPIYKVNLIDFRIPQETIFNGMIVPIVEGWLRPWTRVVKESQRDNGRQLKRDTDARVKESAKLVEYERQKANYVQNIPYKAVKEHVENIHKKGEVADEQLEHFYDS